MNLSTGYAPRLYHTLLWCGWSPAEAREMVGRWLDSPWRLKPEQGRRGKWARKRRVMRNA